MCYFKRITPPGDDFAAWERSLPKVCFNGSSSSYLKILFRAYILIMNKITRSLIISRKTNGWHKCFLKIYIRLYIPRVIIRVDQSSYLIFISFFFFFLFYFFFTRFRGAFLFLLLFGFLFVFFTFTFVFFVFLLMFSFFLFLVFFFIIITGVSITIAITVLILLNMKK